MYDTENLARWLSTANEVSIVWFVLLAIALMATCVPKTMISILCGVLFSPAIGCGLIVLIATAASSVNYLAGRLFNPRFENRSLVGRTAAAVRGAGFGLHLLVRLSPVPSMIISTMCGTLRCRFVPYTAAAATAAATQWMWVIAASTTTSAIRHSRIDRGARSPDGAGWHDPSIVADGATAWVFAVIAIISAVASSTIIARAAAKKIESVEKVTF